MEALFWGLEYAKVLFCYIFILFIWPSVVFRKYLHTKSKIFRFCFCSTVQIVIITTAVLMLGLMHILNVWVVNILFYGTFLFSLREYVFHDESKKEIQRVMAGSLKLRYFFVRRLLDIRQGFRNMCKRAWKDIRAHLIEYSLLFAVIAFGVLYFSWAPLKDHTYGFGDLYTHHAWIYGLIQGKAFSAGIYPEGMHCVIYLMHTVSGITVYSINLFLGAIHTAVIFLSAYCMMREIFRWRYTPILVLAAFFVIGLKTIDGVVSMSRLQRTLPQEYGMHAQFLCVLFLLRFLKENLEPGWWKKWGWLRNENLLLFTMALAASIAIHFYVTLVAFFLCLPFAIIFIRKIFSNARFLPLVASVVCGVTIAFIPMGFALLSGMQFQGSINWALEMAQGIADEQDYNVSFDDEEDDDYGGITGPDQTIGDEVQGGETAKISLAEKLIYILETIWKNIRKYARRIYNIAYTLIPLGNSPGKFLAHLSILLAGLWAVYKLISGLIGLIFRINAPTAIFDGHVSVIIASFIFVVMFSAPYIGLPELISYMRLGSTEHLLYMMVVAIPIDLILSLFQLFCPKLLMQLSSVAFTAAIFAVSVSTGNYHGYLLNELTRYNAAADVTASITRSMAENSYTIVSSTDDLYQIIEYGRHEELLTFLQQVSAKERYYLPTEYVFIYVEKNPIQHAQTHFISGPSWLATDTYGEDVYIWASRSICPEIYSGTISDDYAEYQIPAYTSSYNAYKNPLSRIIINSKAYKWCQAFEDIYSYDMGVYYEDDDFICYYFKQNTYSLYNLAIDY